MLVLSRRKDERIVIGGSIVITVIEVKGDKVRLGIEAPKEVSVHRHEVHSAIVEEQRLAESGPNGAGAGVAATTPVSTANSLLGPGDNVDSPSSGGVPATERKERPRR
ncbi:MAG: carbon storage regulator CsrA [Planctomycetaceae bacterium]